MTPTALPTWCAELRSLLDLLQRAADHLEAHKATMPAPASADDLAVLAVLNGLNTADGGSARERCGPAGGAPGPALGGFGLHTRCASSSIATSPSARSIWWPFPCNAPAPVSG